MAVSRREALARRGRATYQDVLDAPAHLVAEIVDGTLHTHPRPAPAHTLASSALGNDLGNPFQFGRGGPGGWWILDEPELHLGDEVLVPDLAGWRRERMEELPDTSYFPLAPGLGVRGAVGLDAKGRPPGKAPGLRARRRRIPVAHRADGTGRWRHSSSATGSGCSSRARRTTSR